MTTPSCRSFLNQLDSWLAGDPHPQADAHLRSCSRCRALVQDLAAITSAAADWRASEEPPERVWVSLRAQLDQEGLIRHVPVAAAPSRRWFHRWFAAFPRPALAGAYLAALVALAFALSGPVTKRVDDYRWFAGTQNVTTPLTAQLDAAELSAVASYPDSNPEVLDSLHSNLAIVDNYIALCEKSVREDPEDEVARDYLYDAYHQKADLLAQISERGE